MSRSVIFEPFDRAVIQLSVSDEWYHTNPNGNRFIHWLSIGRMLFAKTDKTGRDYRAYKMVLGPLCVNVAWNKYGKRVRA